MSVPDNTPVQADALVKVTQADREAADRFVGVLTGNGADLMRDLLAHAFARHRLAHQPTREAGKPLGLDEDGMCDDHGTFGCKRCVDAFLNYRAHPPADKARIAELEAEVAPFALHIRNHVPDEQMIEGVGWTATDHRPPFAAMRNRTTNQGGKQS